MDSSAPVKKYENCECEKSYENLKFIYKLRERERERDRERMILRERL